MTFGRPELLWLAAALPLLVAFALVVYARRRRRVARALGEPALVRRLGAGDLARFPLARLLLLLPAAVALGLAAADPRWGAESVETHSSAFNVALALDVSRSMWARDVQPDRLERERFVCRMLLRQLPGDRFGMVVFAGRAYVLTPLTVDHAALGLYVDALDPDMVSEGGSSISSAIRQAVGLVQMDPQIRGDRAVVLLTDGEALESESDVIDAAKQAAAAGVTIFTGGLGTTQGAPVPDLDATGQQIGWKHDQNGSVVVSHLHSGLLRQVAEITHGAYIPVSDPGGSVALASALQQLRRSPGGSGREIQHKPQYPWFVGLALVCLLLDTILARRAVLQAEVAAEEQRVSAGLPVPEAAGGGATGAARPAREAGGGPEARAEGDRAAGSRGRRAGPDSGEAA